MHTKSFINNLTEYNKLRFDNEQHIIDEHVVSYKISELFSISFIVKPAEKIYYYNVFVYK